MLVVKHAVWLFFKYPKAVKILLQRYFIDPVFPLCIGATKQTLRLPSISFFEILRAFIASFGCIIFERMSFIMFLQSWLSALSEKSKSLILVFSLCEIVVSNFIIFIKV